MIEKVNEKELAPGLQNGFSIKEEQLHLASFFLKIVLYKSGKITCKVDLDGNPDVSVWYPDVLNFYTLNVPNNTTKNGKS